MQTMVGKISTTDLFTALYNTDSQALFLINTQDYAIEWCNKKACEIFEVKDKEEFKGQLGQNYHVDPFTEKDIAEVQFALDSNNLFRTSYRYKTKKGKRFVGLFETKRTTIKDILYQIVKIIKLDNTLRTEWNIPDDIELERRSYSHTIKNALSELLSMIYLQLAEIDIKEIDKMEVKYILQAMYKRINALTLLHEHIAYKSNNDRILVSVYLGQLVSDSKELYNDDLLTIVLSVPETLIVRSSFILSIGTIVNELIANSYKHAFSTDQKKEINIKIEKTSNTDYLFYYSDNGRKKSTEVEHKGLGNLIIGMAVEKLKAKFDQQFTNKGYRAKMKFSIKLL